MKELTKKYIDTIKLNEKAVYAQITPLKELFAKEALIYNKNEVKFLLTPKFFNKDTLEKFSKVTDITYSIFDKVINEYLKNPEYRKLFGFSKELEEMILADSGYSVSVPVARIDLFYNEDTGEFKFCEFNTDGTAAMKEEDDMTSNVKSTSVFRKFQEEYNLKNFDIFDNITDNILEVYSTYRYKVEKPVIAIGDYIEDATVQEFLAVKRAFEQKGYEVVVSDIRQLSYKNKYLYYGDKKIDILYRRAVTTDIMKNLSSSLPFKKAILGGKTCIVGHIRTQIVHNKMIFVILAMEETLSFLTEEERDFIAEHIPFTTYLKNGNYDYNSVLFNKDKWVVKPADSYGAQNVYVGVDLTENEWKDALDTAIKNGYLLQEFCPTFKTENCYYDSDGNLIESTFGNMTGLYMFSGKLAGIYSRLSEKGIITGRSGGFSASSIISDK